jgi:hypothetical protein
MSKNQTNPVSELNSSPWVNQAKEHWKKFCPKMYHELEKSGELHERAVEAAEQTQNDLLDAINNHGADYQTAWEAVRERYLFLPAEDDPQYPYK